MLNLFQYSPKIRLYKWAKTLELLGYSPVVTYTATPTDNIDWSGLKAMRAYQSYPIRNKFDAILSFNPNIDVFPCFRNHARIECVGDLVSYGKPNKTEQRNLETAKACVFVSDVQMEQAVERYPSIEGKSFVVYNGLIAEQLQAPLKPRRKSDKLQLVFAGSLSAKAGHHRDLSEDFRLIASLPGVDFHIYAYPYLPEEYNYIGATIHNYVPDEQLVSELSQYDAGLIYWHKNDPIGNCSLSNKWFCYTAAGLNIVTKPYRQQLLMNQDNLCLFEAFSEISSFAPPTKKERLATSKSVLTYESQVDKIREVLSRAT